MKKILVILVFLLCISLVYGQMAVRAVDSVPTGEEPYLVAVPVDPDPPEVKVVPVPGALPELPGYCPDDMYLCDNNDCVKAKCECDYSCGPSDCPVGTWLCDNGQCVETVRDCVDNCAYKDSKGRCVDLPCEIKCRNGRCVDDLKECEECPHKCRDGRCVNNARECEEQCEDGYTECMDGVCRVDEDCPVKPICECPKGYEMCDSGYCVRDLDQCKELRMNKADLVEGIVSDPGFGITKSGLHEAARPSKPKEIVVVGSKAKSDAVIKGSKIAENDGDPDRPVVTGKDGEEIYPDETTDKDHKDEIDIEAMTEEEKPGLGGRISGFFKNLFS